MLNDIPIGGYLKLSYANMSVIWYKKDICVFRRLAYEGTRLTSSILSKRIQAEEEDIQYLLHQGFKKVP